MKRLLLINKSLKISTNCDSSKKKVIHLLNQSETEEVSKIG